MNRREFLAGAVAVPIVAAVSALGDGTTFIGWDVGLEPSVTAIAEYSVEYGTYSGMTIVNQAHGYLAVMDGLRQHWFAPGETRTFTGREPQAKRNRSRLPYPGRNPARITSLIR